MVEFDIALLIALLLGFAPMNIEQIVADLRAERDRIDSAIAALEGFTGSHGRGRAGMRGRRMSAAARKRIGEAKRKWWAARRGKAGARAAATRAAAVPTKTGTKRKGRRVGISAAGRKRLSEMMKQRWAARKQQQGAAR